MAQLWQTPEVGEEVVNGMRTASRAERVTMMTVSGMNEHAAADVADALDTMADCILPLYRSGAQPVVGDLGRELAATDLPPGLALDPSEDPYVGPAGRAAEMADQLGARHAPLDGAGHWWMCEQPAAAADLLVEFWGSLDA
jgi:pimeloyl-ACP methyl ester carboxylesterase